MNLLSLDNATDRIASMEGDEWRNRRKNYSTLMCIYKLMQLLLSLQIKHLDGLVIRPRNDKPVVTRHRN